MTQSIKQLVRWNLLERAALLISDGDPTFQGSRDVLFAPIGKALIRIGLNADLLSVLGLVFAILASFVVFNPLLAGFLLAISLLLDGLDGVVARLTNTATTRGEVLDIFCDTAGMLFVLVGLVCANFLDLNYFIFYSLVLVVYTAVSACKSRLLLGKYRSIGSRVVVTSYAILCLSITQFLPSNGALHSTVFNYGVLFVGVLLLVNLFWDFAGLAIRAISNRVVHGHI